MKREHTFWLMMVFGSVALVAMSIEPKATKQSGHEGAGATISFRSQ
jgi:hypothetical protein